MKDITSLDSNFKVESKLDVPDIEFYNTLQEPFKVYGVYYGKDKFIRMPIDVAKNVNEGVYWLNFCTAGGRVRFKTDSPYVAIHAKMPPSEHSPHFAVTGRCGFDLYVGNGYFKTFVPPADIKDGYESLIQLGSPKMREITINFPLYHPVHNLYIGLSDSASVLPPEPYKTELPIVFYGSSITQGACASRPGNCYQNFISRRLSADYLNLGFSGNAKGEDEMADYISGLTMSAFVYDYDYNAPTVEHLQKTHERMFKKIRTANPELPIIMLSRPRCSLSEDDLQRLEVIKTTYKNAIESGDKNVYLIEGPKLMELAGNDGTVDDCHPNDLGFASMAKAIGDILEKIL